MNTKGKEKKKKTKKTNKRLQIKVNETYKIK